MLFVPVDKFTLLSAKTPFDLAAVLNESIAKKKASLIRAPEEPFSGSADQCGFELAKTWGGQAGIVNIKGNFVSVGDATHIEVSQRPKTMFIGFAFLWMIGLLAFAGIGLAASFSDQYGGAANLLSVVFAVFMAGAGAIVFLQMFWGEA